MLIGAMVWFQGVFAQDYFEDAKGSGSPILFGKGSGLVSARFNVGDNSTKINLFHFFPLGNPEGKSHNIHTGREMPPPVDDPERPPYFDDRTSHSLGIGGFFKAKTEDGLGTLFQGQLTPGIQTGAYFAYRNSEYKNLRGALGDRAIYSNWVVLGTVGLSHSTLQLYDPNKPFEQQLSDTLFTGWDVGLSTFKIIPIDSADQGNLIVGMSIKLSKENNYGDLKKVKIVDTQSIIDTTSGTVRNVSTIRKDDVFRTGSYSTYMQFVIRPHATIIPRFLGNRGSITGYLPLIFSQGEFKVNGGMSFNFLKKGEPAISVVGVYCEFANLFGGEIIEQGESSHLFPQRMTVGVTAALNLPNFGSAD